MNAASTFLHLSLTLKAVFFLCVINVGSMGYQLLLNFQAAVLSSQFVAIQVAALLLYLAQALFIVRGKRIVWMLSLGQCVFAFFISSEYSFSFVFNFLYREYALSMGTLAPWALLALEVAKTGWLYRDMKTLRRS